MPIAAQTQFSSGAQIGGVPAAAPSEVETALSRLSNSLDCLMNAQSELASRLHPVSRPQAPEATTNGVREAMSCQVSEALQAARETVDTVTARINASIALLAI